MALGAHFLKTLCLTLHITNKTIKLCSLCNFFHKTIDKINKENVLVFLYYYIEYKTLNLRSLKEIKEKLIENKHLRLLPTKMFVF